MTSKIEYLYSEDVVLAEVQQYIDNTYSGHYAGGGKAKKIQALDMIIEGGFGWGFCIGNILKYAFRADKKKQKKADLLKVIHYAIFALHLMRLEEEQTEVTLVNVEATPEPSWNARDDMLSVSGSEKMMLYPGFNSKYRAVLNYIERDAKAGILVITPEKGDLELTNNGKVFAISTEFLNRYERAIT